jgi:hypothetical protein
MAVRDWPPAQPFRASSKALEALAGFHRLWRPAGPSRQVNKPGALVKLGIEYRRRESHTAGTVTKKVNWIPDADISHEKLMESVELRIADPRILRLIGKWLEAGVSEDAQWSETKVGTPGRQHNQRMEQFCWAEAVRFAAMTT